MIPANSSPNKSSLLAPILLQVLLILSAGAAPVIDSIVGSSTTQGGQNLTINGSGFGLGGGFVTIGTSPAPPISYADTQIVCIIPPGQGSDLPVKVTIGPESSNTKLFSYDPPSITLLSPDTGPTAGGTTLTLTGQSLGTTGATVSVGGNNAPVISQNHGQVTCQLPAGQGSGVDVVVTVAGQSSSPATFSYSAPLITSVVTPSGKPTAGSVTVEINGINLGTSAASLTLGGSPVPVTSQDHTKIEFTLPEGQGSNLPLFLIVGGQFANPQFFSYDSPAVTLISPTSSGTEGGGTMTIDGSNFGLTLGSVTIGGVGAPILTQDHTELTCVIPEGQGANLAVQVMVGSQSTIATSGFSYDAPVLTTILPNKGLASDTSMITLTGSNFGAAAPTISFGGANPVPSSWSHSSITFTKPVSAGGDIAVTVTAGGQSSAPLNFRSVDLTSLPGYYVNLDLEDVLPAPTGSYTPAANATTPTPAPAGFYCPVPGMQSAIPASPGYYVPAPGASAQTPAGIGTYSSGSGNQVALDTPAGSYAPILGCRTPIQAPDGTYVPNGGSGTALAIPAGFTTAGAGAFELVPLPQVQITSYSVGSGGQHTIGFETSSGQNYGIYYSENLKTYVLLENVAGTGSPVSRTVTAPGIPTNKGFFVVAPAGAP